MSVIEQELQRCETKLSALFERLHLSQATVGAPNQRKRTASTLPYQQDIAQLRRQLGPEQCLLAYFAYEGTLLIFILTREALTTREAPGAAAQLERLLPLLYAHLSPMGWPDMAHPPQQAIQRLLQKLL